MARINFAFWNLQNLFDAVVSEIAADLAFTPENGWTEAAVEKKIENLAAVIEPMFGPDEKPDLLGICEIENLALAVQLLKKLGWENDYAIAHDPSPDLRGIDCSLIYSKKKFELISGDPPTGHMVNLRFATRDIFEVPLRLNGSPEVDGSTAELTVFVNHWPSRSRGTAESEPFRVAVAAHLGRLIDRRLKLNRTEVLGLSHTNASRASVLDRWNRNILVMGDLNDDPFNRSVMSELGASNSIDQLEEEPLGKRDKKPKNAHQYLRRTTYLYNYMWQQLAGEGAGTIYWSGGGEGRTKQVFDQIIASRGLHFGLSGLKMDPASVEIFDPKIMWSNSRLTAEHAAENRHLIRPKKFEVKKSRGRFQIKGGYSDHFPVLGAMETVANSS